MTTTKWNPRRGGTNENSSRAKMSALMLVIDIVKRNELLRAQLVDGGRSISDSKHEHNNKSSYSCGQSNIVGSKNSIIYKDESDRLRPQG